MKMRGTLTRDLILAVMAASWLLAVAKPVFSVATGRPDPDGTFSIAWGIPSQWYATGKDARPACLDVPVNSIGLDYLNMDRCRNAFGSGVAIYKQPCPCDPFLRFYPYPPLMTLLFGWTSWVTTLQGIVIWCSAVLGLVFANGLAWALLWRSVTRPEVRVSDPAAPAVFWPAAGIGVLFTLTYPSLFAFERGNCDVWVLVLMTAAAVCWARRRWVLLGAALAAAALLKVYPILIVSGVCAAAAGLCVLSKTRSVAWPSVRGIILGVAAAAALLLAVFWESSVYYFFHALPTYAGWKQAAANHVNAHSLSAAFGPAGLGIYGALWLGAVAVLAAEWFKWLKGPARPAGVLKTLKAFAFLTGLSVYLANTSYDYNLILWIPYFSLFLCVDDRLPADGVRSAGIGLLAAGCFLPRWLSSVVWPECPFSVFLVLQLTGMVLCLISAGRDALRPAESAERSAF